ncbi:MAG: hypothetical protein GXO36_02565 [Chloroflexi bacterium]|nr:hypothetical protein [Chloroflexota bacterium]
MLGQGPLRWVWAWLLWGWFGLGLAACGGLAPATSPPPPAIYTATATPVRATPTPTALPPALAIVEGPDTPPTAATWADRTRAWADARGWRWLTVPDGESLPPLAPFGAILALPPVSVDEAAAWARAYPQARVLAWAEHAPSEPDALPQNLTVVVTQGLDVEKQVFLAGYATALATTHFRAGFLYTSPPGYAAEFIADLFAQGARYYCGLCNPAYPPVLAYPLAVEVPPGVTDQTTWEENARRLLALGPFEAVFVYGPPEAAWAIPVLKEKNVTVLWAGEPVEGADVAFYADVWALLDDAWGHAWLEGEVEPIVRAPWQVRVLQPNAFSPGRVRRFETVLREVLAGYVAPYVEPTPAP